MEGIIDIVLEFFMYIWNDCVDFGLWFALDFMRFINVCAISKGVLNVFGDSNWCVTYMSHVKLYIV